MMLTYEEAVLLEMFYEGTREKTLMHLKTGRIYIAADDYMAAELTDELIYKLENMTDEEFQYETEQLKIR